MIQRSRRISPAEKAAYHQEAGAGRSRVKRKFLGLTEADEDAILARIEQHLTDEVNR